LVTVSHPPKKEGSLSPLEERISWTDRVPLPRLSQCYRADGSTNDEMA